MTKEAHAVAMAIAWFVDHAPKGAEVTVSTHEGWTLFRTPTSGVAVSHLALKEGSANATDSLAGMFAGRAKR